MWATVDQEKDSKHKKQKVYESFSDLEKRLGSEMIIHRSK